ncbi:hypothetical protein HDU97_000048 [Phlyctochytrium planicorne]|nr:hypothetical protein HDU97_000048 [Phlyctochytrium planicorne]
MDFFKKKIIEEAVGDNVEKIAGQVLGDEMGKHVGNMAEKIALDVSDGHIDMKADSKIIFNGVSDMIQGKPVEEPKPQGIMGFVDNLMHGGKHNEEKPNHQPQPQQHQQNGEGGLLSSVMAATSNGEGGALGPVGALIGKLTGNRELEQELKEREQRCDITTVCTSTQWALGDGIAIFWYAPFFSIPGQKTMAIKLYRVNDPASAFKNVPATSMGPQPEPCSPIGADMVHSWMLDPSLADKDVVESFKVWPNTGTQTHYAVIHLDPIADLVSPL